MYIAPSGDNANLYFTLPISHGLCIVVSSNQAVQTTAAAGKNEPNAMPTVRLLQGYLATSPYCKRLYAMRSRFVYPLFFAEDSS